MARNGMRALPTAQSTTLVQNSGINFSILKPMLVGAARLFFLSIPILPDTFSLYTPDIAIEPCE